MFDFGGGFFVSGEWLEKDTIAAIERGTAKPLELLNIDKIETRRRRDPLDHVLGYLEDGVIMCSMEPEGAYASCNLGAHILLEEI